MRLNKDPPLDAPVVEFVGVAEPPTPITAIPLSAQRRGSSGGGRDAAALERGVKMTGSGESVLGEEALEGEAKDEEAEELKKIKGEDLGNDDSCVVCLSGEKGIVYKKEAYIGRSR